MDTDRKYYIIVNGDTHEGPFTYDEIIAHPRFSPTAPVWRDGLADWAQAQTIVDFADYFANNAPQPNIPHYKSQNTTGAYYNPQRPGNAGMPNWWYTDTRRERKMPSNYLIFSIIVTICCCIPTGIVAIIYSSKVSNAYYRGEYERAEELSHSALLWCIISLVLGLMCLPLTGMMQFLMV